MNYNASNEFQTSAQGKKSLRISECRIKKCGIYKCIFG